MADKSAQNIIDAVENSKEIPEILSLPLASVMWVNISQRYFGRPFPRLDDFFHLSEASHQQVEEVGPEVAASIVRFLGI